MNLHNNIQALRLEHHWTQEQLAAMVGVSTAAVSKWETGNSYPDITLLPTLAELFNVSLDYLFGCRRAEEKSLPHCIAQANQLDKDGQRDDAIILLRKTLERYPQNELLLFELARHLFVSTRFRSPEKRNERLREAEKLFLSVAEQTQEANRRSWCYQFLTTICMTNQDYERAEQYNAHLLPGPGLYPKVTAAVIALKSRPAEEAEHLMRNTLAESLQEYLYMSRWYCTFLMDREEYDRAIALCSRALQILSVGIEEGQAYLFKEKTAFSEAKAASHAHLEQPDACIHALEEAARSACSYDALELNLTYDVYDLSGEQFEQEEKIVCRKQLLHTLESEERQTLYAFLREHPAYRRIIDRLTSESLS